MKLKQIPNNTVVHTPTEAEAKVLLAILHEGGYTYCDGESLLDNDWLIDLYDKNNELECLGIEPYAKITKHIEHCNIGWYRKQGYTILTLAEFKERYCEEEKPQPKFKVGDKVRIINDCGCSAYGLIGRVESVDTREVIVSCGDSRLYCLPEWLEPYAEPDTKDDTKDTMELNSETLTDDCKSSVKVEKGLNLCELLDNGDLLCSLFYSPAFGEVSFEENRASEGEIEIETKTEGVIFVLDQYGRIANEDGVCILYPSRALYEQYPLDPYTAWMKWQEEQKKYPMTVVCYDSLSSDKCELLEGDIYFRTPADRDKCIEEIKTIIEKYSKV